LRRIVVVLGLSAAAACVAHGRPNPVHRNQYELQYDELGSFGASATLYEVVSRLRHRWLERRQQDPAVPEATDEVLVYAGSRLLGGVDQLQSIMARDVYWVRYYGPREAASLYGPGHSSGVIVVIMK
jgi:hypothetical protein